MRALGDAAHTIELRLLGGSGQLAADLAVTGDFDGMQVELFEELSGCLPSRVRSVTVDLRETRMLDSSGLRSLIRLRERCISIDCPVAVVISKPFQRKLLEVAGLYDHLRVTFRPEEPSGPDPDDVT